MLCRLSQIFNRSAPGVNTAATRNKVVFPRSRPLPFSPRITTVDPVSGRRGPRVREPGSAVPVADAALRSERRRHLVRPRERSLWRDAACRRRDIAVPQRNRSQTERSDCSRRVSHRAQAGEVDPPYEARIKTVLSALPNTIAPQHRRQTGCHVDDQRGANETQPGKGR